LGLSDGGELKWRGPNPVAEVVAAISHSSTLEEGACFEHVPISKGLILAQNERWRRGLGMQVVRAARPVAQG